MKHSTANTLLFGPTPRQKPVGTAGGSALDEFDVEVRDVVGHVDGGVDGVDVDALLEGRRQPARQDRRARDLVFPADDLAVRRASPR